MPRSNWYALRKSLSVDGIVYPGRRCKNGHDGTRYLSSGRCVQCRKLAKQNRRERYWPTNYHKNNVGELIAEVDKVPPFPQEERIEIRRQDYYTPSGWIAAPTKERLMSGR